jgi:3-methylcrotonyl-CoA carboxylase alpha subunit
VLRHLDLPEHVAFELGGIPGQPAAVRVDAGVREGDAISPFYDPMIAKLIVWGPDRNAALARMAQALSDFHVVGLATNVAFLKRLVESPAFSSAELDTGLIERQRDALFPPPGAAPVTVLALAVAALLAEEGAAVAASATTAGDPWTSTHGWRLNGAARRRLAFSDEHGACQLDVTYHAHGWTLQSGDARHALALASRDGGRCVIRLDGRQLAGTVRREGDVLHVFADGRHHALSWADPLAHTVAEEAAHGRLNAPMPGKVIAVMASAGQHVKKGEPLVIMEAMKMEHTIAAPFDGVVEEVLYAVGDQVADGAPLLAFETAA